MNRDKINIAVVNELIRRGVSCQFTPDASHVIRWGPLRIYGAPVEDVSICALFEGTLNTHEWYEYSIHLAEVYEPHDCVQMVTTALQKQPLARCVAFLKVARLWEEN